MSKTGRNNPRRTTREVRRNERRLSVRAIRLEVPDVRRLGRAFIALAMADAERQAQETAPRRARTDASNRNQPPAEEAE